MSTTHTAVAPKLASPAQISFIASLLATRDVPTKLRDAIATAGPMTMAAASLIITTLKDRPTAPAVKAPDVSGSIPPREMAAAIAGLPITQIPVGRYAIPTLEMPDLGLVKDKQDLMFFRVSEYMGRRRLVRLSGAPGYFNSYRIAPAMVREIAEHINKDALHYTQMFASHFSVCGRCLAELTDVDSRAAGLGPTCRKAFGLN